MTIKYDCGCFLVELFNYHEQKALKFPFSREAISLLACSPCSVDDVDHGYKRSIMMTDQKQRKEKRPQTLTRRKFQLRQIRKTVQRVCENTKLK